MKWTLGLAVMAISGVNAGSAMSRPPKDESMPASIEGQCFTKYTNHCEYYYQNVKYEVPCKANAQCHKFFNKCTVKINRRKPIDQQDPATCS
ncbi:hypothetical protein PCL_05289 [Purpureocillium lilacinum]|uniref:Uncharacterized protein n=1 Tax=Purpureocillium lilacinum TaxID=33203 RepID=A0A2U3DVS1_PURLI|nr:hypothetical protein PCL_05289 [Purpureocillium lilacinum]